MFQFITLILIIGVFLYVFVETYPMEVINKFIDLLDRAFQRRLDRADDVESLLELKEELLDSLEEAKHPYIANIYRRHVTLVDYKLATVDQCTDQSN